MTVPLCPLFLDQRYILPIERSINQHHCQPETVKLDGRNHPESVDGMERNMQIGTIWAHFTGINVELLF